VTDNRFQAADAFAGIHLQPDAAPIDGARIDGMGWLRRHHPAVLIKAVFDSSGHQRCDRRQHGPRSMGQFAQRSGAYNEPRREESIERGCRYGILFFGEPQFPNFVDAHNTFRSNVRHRRRERRSVREVGVRECVCREQPTGNGATSALSSTPRQAPTRWWVTGTIVTDNGAFDCNGDG